MGIFGEYSDLKRKINGGVRGTGYYVWIDAFGAGWNYIPDNLKPINMAEFLAFKGIVEQVVEEEKELILAKSASAPSSNIEVVNIDWKGHQMRLPSNRTYDPYDLTFFNTPSQVLYDFFIAWQHLASNFLGPDGNTMYQSPYMIESNILLVQTDASRNIIGGWIMTGAWPSTVSSIDHSSENNDATEYTVTFQIEKALRVPIASLSMVGLVPHIFGYDLAGLSASMFGNLA